MSGFDKISAQDEIIFTGNIYIFQAFDVGEDVNLEKVKTSNVIMTRSLVLSKYFKKYHIPIAVDIPHPNTSSKCIGAKVHNFGVISLAYKIPFEDTLSNVRKDLEAIDAEFQEQSIEDAGAIFKQIKQYTKHPRFFHLRTSYVVIQVDPQPTKLTIPQLKEDYAGVIASLVRFETESLSEYQKHEIMDTAIGYYRGDLFVIDIQVAFIYDEEYEEIIDLFEFANIQQLELQYFDRLLDQELNTVYQNEVRKLPLKNYLPFIGTSVNEPIEKLGMLKVEISVIIERLESSVKLAGEAHASELYRLIMEKLDLRNWKESIDNKLEIIQDLNTLYQNKIDTIREHLLEVLIIILIFIELVIGVLSYFK